MKLDSLTNPSENLNINNLTKYLFLFFRKSLNFSFTLSGLGVSSDGCFDFKYCICWANVSVVSTAMWHHSLRQSVCLYLCVWPTSKVLHLFRKWSSQSCRQRPHTQLLWQPTQQRAMVHAASPNWSPPLAQVMQLFLCLPIDFCLKWNVCSAKLWKYKQHGQKSLRKHFL